MSAMEVKDILSTERVSALGQGLISITGEGLNTALDVEDKNIVKSDSEAKYTSYVCSSKEEIDKALSISGSVSVSYGLANVSAKASYANSLKMSSTSVCIIIHGTLEQTSSSSNFTMKDNLTDDLDQFFRSYGDSFVSSIKHGAEFFLSIMIETNSTQEQTKLKAELEGKGSFELIQAKLEAKLDSSNSEKNSDYKCSIKSHTYGFDGVSNLDIPDGSDLNKVNGFINQFMGIKFNDLTSPKQLSYSLGAYSRFDLKRFEIFDKNLSYFLGNSIEENEDCIYRFLVELENKKVIFTALDSLYKTYNYTNDEKLTTSISNCNKGINDILTQIIEYTKCGTKDYSEDGYTKASFLVLDLGIPKLQYEINTQTFGDFKNTVMSDLVFLSGEDESIIKNQTKITEIIINSGIYVDNLGINYENQLTGNSTSLFHGGSGGSEQKIDLDKNTFINKISTKSGAYIDHIEIKTTAQDLVGGGNGGTDEKEWIVPEDSCVLYFTANTKLPAANSIEDYGLSDDYLYAFKVIYVTFKNATWS